jgi:hypothetical protein
MTNSLDDRTRLESLYDRVVGDPPTRRDAGFFAALFGVFSLLALAAACHESFAPVPVAALVATVATTAVLAAGAVAPTERLPVARETAIGLGFLGAAGCLFGFAVMLVVWPDHTWYQGPVTAAFGLQLAAKAREAFAAADEAADTAGGWA